MIATADALPCATGASVVARLTFFIADLSAHPLFAPIWALRTGQGFAMSWRLVIRIRARYYSAYAYACSNAFSDSRPKVACITRRYGPPPFVHLTGGTRSTHKRQS